MFEQVVEARALVPKDMGGTSDPYVKLNYNTRSYTSHTIFKTTNPVWGDTFVFSENSSLVSKRIRGEVWDKDFTSSDDREGFFFVDLNLASEGKITDRWFQVISCLLHQQPENMPIESQRPIAYS